MNTSKFRSKIACSLVIYKPTIYLLKEFLKSNEDNFEFNRSIDEIKCEIKESKEIIKNVIFYICDLLGEKNIVKSRKVILGTSLYYSCLSLSQYMAAQLANVSSVSIRALSKIMSKKNHVDIHKIIVKTVVRQLNRLIQNFMRSNLSFNKILTIKNEVVTYHLPLKTMIKLIHVIFYKKSKIMTPRMIICCAIFLSCPNISLYETCLLTKIDIHSVENILKHIQKRVSKTNKRILTLFKTMVKKAPFIKRVDELRRLM